jgi:hypothetical protein
MTLRYFTRDEFGADYAFLDPLLLRRLDELRERVRVPIVIHPHPMGGAGRAADSQHPLGRAVDCHAVGIVLGDFWLAAERDPWLRGIGVYPYWTNPGLHLDTRTSDLRARWWRDAAGRYAPVTAAVLREIL